MAACDALDHCFVVRSHSVHRIQETQAAMTLSPLGGSAGASAHRCAGARATRRTTETREAR